MSLRDDYMMNMIDIAVTNNILLPVYVITNKDIILTGGFDSLGFHQNSVQVSMKLPLFITDQSFPLLITAIG